MTTRVDREQSFRRAFWIITFSVLSSTACDGAPSAPGSGTTSVSGDAGFEAVITGAYDGKVTGAGTLVLLRDAGFEKQGYYFLADERGLRPHGVTFVLPRGIGTGRYALSSPTPLELGTVPSVRVDRDTGNAVIASDRATVGELELVAFPPNEDTRIGV